MQQTDEGREVKKQPDEVFDEQELAPRPFARPSKKLTFAVLGVVAALALMVVLPPLVNVNRYRRQIATSIGASLGRPVHLESVTLDVLPLPGFTLENFVVSEDPAFGAEPVIRANSVRATLRVSSLWRRRVEFSRISLDEPSVNLVHLPDGRWNVESILLQAAKMPAAPTAQKDVGDTPRFPYIEATGARINIKQALEKMPISLSDAKFALWLGTPETWHLRLEAHPSRTDTAATDTGTLHLEGTLGSAPQLQNVPVDITGDWTGAPLGAVSSVLTGRDFGLRGQMTLSATLHGTVGQNLIESRLLLNQVRRSDFVPVRMLDVDLACGAQTTALFHAIHTLRCTWPADAKDKGLSVVGDLPDITHPQTARVAARVKDVPAAGVLDLLRLLSRRVSPQLTAAGEITGDVQCCADAADGRVQRDGLLKGGQLLIANASLGDGDGHEYLHEEVRAEFSGRQMMVQSTQLDLGASSPALVDGFINSQGYGMHLRGGILRERLLDLAAALPQFGDGVADALAAPTAEPLAPIKVDLTSMRPWGGAQVWTQLAATKPVRRSRSPGRRRPH